MPLYEFLCADLCGVVEVFKGMEEPSPTRCPKCKALDFQRIYSHNFVPAVDSQWKDKYIPQLGKEYLDPFTKKHKNPKAHFNSLNEVRECVAKRGQTLDL